MRWSCQSSLRFDAAGAGAGSSRLQQRVGRGHSSVANKLTLVGESDDQLFPGFAVWRRTCPDLHEPQGRQSTGTVRPLTTWRFLNSHCPLTRASSSYSRP